MTTELSEPTSQVNLGTFAGSPDLSLNPDQRNSAVDNLRRFWTGDPAALEGLNSEAPDKAQSYRLNYGEYAATEGDNLGALDNEIRTGFAAADIPSSHAQSLLDAILSTSGKYQPNASDADTAFARSQEMSQFNALPNSAELLHYAKLAYQALPQTLRDTLDKRGALNSAQAYVALANIGRQFEYQTKKGKN